MTVERLRRHAVAIHEAALRSVDPASRVEAWLRAHPFDGPIVVVGAGKATAAMALGAARVLGARLAGGCIVVPDGPLPPLPVALRVLRGDHPVPGVRSLAGGQALLECVRAIPPGAPILGLWSGGASALIEVPVAGTLEALAADTRAWLREGVPIATLNARRTARSAVKGGGLARATRGVFRNLVVSDVPGDDPALVGSGPAVLPGDGSTVVAGLADALRGAKHEAFGLRYGVTVLDPAVSGPARALGARLASTVRALPEDAPPLCLLCGGEPVVEVRGRGRGGRMQETALAAAIGLEGTRAVVLAASTDGRDGPTDASGGLVDGQTAPRIRVAGLDPQRLLDDNDSHRALAASGDLYVTGPTGTNVADLVIVLLA